jgi:hypothetical protein
MRLTSATRLSRTTNFGLLDLALVAALSETPTFARGSSHTLLPPALSFCLLCRAANEEVFEDELAFTSNERSATASAYNLPVSHRRFRFYANEFVTSPTIWAGERFHWLLRHDATLA